MAVTAQTPDPPAQEGTLRPLRHRLFRALWLATVFSNIGTWMHDISAAWLMTTLSSAPILVALVTTAGSLPMFLLALPAGALADILDRRRLLLVTQFWMLASAALLGLLTIAGWTSPGVLLALTAILAAGAALNMPAWQAITPELVPHQEVAAAVSLGGVSFNLARAIGPALGGPLAGRSRARTRLSSSCTLVCRDHLCPGGMAPGAKRTRLPARAHAQRHQGRDPLCSPRAPAAVNSPPHVRLHAGGQRPVGAPSSVCERVSPFGSLGIWNDDGCSRCGCPRRCSLAPHPSEKTLTRYDDEPLHARLRPGNRIPRRGGGVHRLARSHGGGGCGVDGHYVHFQRGCTAYASPPGSVLVRSRSSWSCSWPGWLWGASCGGGSPG